MLLPSVVARSQPLLSHLRRRVAAAAPGGAKPKIFPSRAYGGSVTPGARCNGSADERTSAAADRHLYVVLQEKAMNRFSIYKLPHVDDDDETPRRLPRAVLHLGESLVTETPQFEALGSKIVVTADIISRNFLTLLYDTKTETVDGTQWDPRHMWVQNRYHAAAPVGDKLCVLEAEGTHPFYLYKEHARAEWAWQQGLEELPVDATRMQRLSGPGSIKSLVVHPDGRNIFASSSAFTFSLDTESGESARLGDWRLPFQGRAYYDGHLEALVGIRLADGTEGGSIKGQPYLCACDVPTALADGTMLPEPAWKMCKKELTFAETPAFGTSPALVHTGHGKFCLVEVSEGVEASRPPSDGLGHLLRVTMFHATHGRSGELEVTPYRPGRSYFVPNYSKGFYTAIWI